MVKSAVSEHIGVQIINHWCEMKFCNMALIRYGWPSWNRYGWPSWNKTCSCCLYGFCY